MKMTSKIIAAALISGMSLAVVPAHAAVVVWTIQNGAFDDGTSFGGTFTHDSLTNQISAFNIVTGNGVLGGFEYSLATASAFSQPGFGPNNLLFFANQGNRYLNLTFADPLSGSATSHAILTTSSYECTNCGAYRLVSSGSVISAAVPEPASWATMISGFGLLGGALRRRQRAVVSYA